MCVTFLIFFSFTSTLINNSFSTFCFIRNACDHMKTRTNEPVFYLNLFQPCTHTHTHTAVGLGRGPWIEVNQKACPVWVKICSWWIRCPHEDDYFGQNARSVHSKNANRRFKVSQDFVPSTEGTIFGPWHYDCKPHHNETLFSLADLKKKKLYVPTGGQGWTVRSPSNLNRHARHSCVAGRREREFQSCWLLLTWATVPTQTAVYELDSASKTHNIRCRTTWCGRASSCYMSSTMDGASLIPAEPSFALKSCLEEYFFPATFRCGLYETHSTMLPQSSQFFNNLF